MTIRYRAQQWLSAGGSYREGVNLLEMAGAMAAARRHGPVLQQSFISERQKLDLRNDLVRLISQLPEEEDIAPAAPPPSAMEAQKVPDTPRIIAIRNTAKGLHKERSDLKSRLLVRGLDEPEKYTDAQRLELAREIMESNVPALDALYDQLRRFEVEGIEPADDAEMIKQQTVNDMKEVYNLRPRISRLKKAKPAQPEELKKLEDRLEELEQLLGL